MDVAAHLLIVWTILIFLSFYVKNGTLFLLVAGVHVLYFMLLYLVLGEEFSKDSANYYLWATTDQRVGYLGTELMVAIVRLFAVYMNLNYLSISAVFSILAVSGLYMVLQSIVQGESNLLVRLLSAGVILSPSFNVFTSLIAKESIVLFLFGLLMSNLRHDRPIISLCLAVLIGAIRPYFGAALAAAIIAPTLVRYVTMGRGGMVVLLAGYVALVGAISLNVSVDISYLNKYGISTNIGVLTAIESRRDIYSETESGYDPLSYGIAGRAVVYIFGTGDGVKMDIFRILVFLEGILYFSVLVVAGWRLVKDQDRDMMATSIYLMSMLLVLLLASVTGNAGLAARQRMMPVLMGLVAVGLSHRAAADAREGFTTEGRNQLPQRRA